MRVITAQTMQEIDRQAIEESGIPGLELMESAGRCCLDVILAEFGQKGHAVVFSGGGNNGGDGYVIARLLLQNGWDVNVIVLADREQICGDAASNLNRLPADSCWFYSRVDQSTALQEKIRQADVLVDALFGTGLRSDIGGIYRQVVELINASGRPVLAVDIPSGIDGTTGQIMGNAVRATLTVTFASAKLGHVLFPGAEHTGRLVVADIGIPPEFAEAASGYDFLNEHAIWPLLNRRDRKSHKGQFGHCLIIAGSRGKTGAAALSANSAVRAGSGLVTLAVADTIHTILEIKTTEAMTSPLADSGNGYLTESSFPDIEKLLSGVNAVAIGPGLGTLPGTAALIRAVVETVTLPLVIDADGLNALAQDMNALRRKKSDLVVLTPHPGELARMLGVQVQDIEKNRISVSRDFARDYGVYLVLKGSRTIIAAPDGATAINGSGNPGMATGGMGDVLTGIIVSLLGQGYTAGDACRAGVFLHGYAADLVAEEKGEIGINASDIQEKLPYAVNKLLNNKFRSNRKCSTNSEYRENKPC